MAYTASFGGGFSATLAAQSPGTEGGSGGGTQQTGALISTPTAARNGHLQPHPDHLRRPEMA